MDKWTPVTPEDMPENQQRVLTYCPTQCPGFRVNVHTYYTHITSSPRLVVSFSWWIGQQNYAVEEMNVTHWQPLPTGSEQ